MAIFDFAIVQGYYCAKLACQSAIIQSPQPLSQCCNMLDKKPSTL